MQLPATNMSHTTPGCINVYAEVYESDGLCSSETVAVTRRQIEDWRAMIQSVVSGCSTVAKVENFVKDGGWPLSNVSTLSSDVLTKKVKELSLNDYGSYTASLYYSDKGTPTVYLMLYRSE